jgi:hypothetical protein
MRSLPQRVSVNEGRVHRRASGRADRPVAVGARHLDERVTGKEAPRIAYVPHALQPQVDGLRVRRLCLAQQ